eukprot:gene40040-40153_t
MELHSQVVPLQWGTPHPRTASPEACPDSRTAVVRPYRLHRRPHRRSWDAPRWRMRSPFPPPPPPPELGRAEMEDAIADAAFEGQRQQQPLPRHPSLQPLLTLPRAEPQPMQMETRVVANTGGGLAATSAWGIAEAEFYRVKARGRAAAVSVRLSRLLCDKNGDVYKVNMIDYKQTVIDLRHGGAPRVMVPAAIREIKRFGRLERPESS